LTAAAAAAVSFLTMLLKLTVMTRMMRRAAQAAMMMTTMTCLASSPMALRRQLLVASARSLRGGWGHLHHACYVALSAVLLPLGLCTTVTCLIWLCGGQRRVLAFDRIMRRVAQAVIVMMTMTCLASSLMF
jgi:hypothetical protein